MVAATLFACPSAKAESPAEISDRIAGAFALMPVNAPELTFQLKRMALQRLSVDGGLAVDQFGAFIGGEIEFARLPRPRPEPNDLIITGSIPAPASTADTEAEFFGRFAGSFSGSGEVRRSANAAPNEVQCTVTGQPSQNRIAIAGRCGVGMFSREISADIRYDPASHRYSGTYVGASVGPARLSGTRRGDAVVLTITWPKPVNGDTKATMTIRNSGNHQLAITVTDEFQPGGARTEVTQLALNQI